MARELIEVSSSGRVYAVATPDGPVFRPTLEEVVWAAERGRLIPSGHPAVRSCYERLAWSPVASILVNLEEMPL